MVRQYCDWTKASLLLAQLIEAFAGEPFVLLSHNPLQPPSSTKLSTVHTFLVSPDCILSLRYKILFAVHDTSSWTFSTQILTQSTLFALILFSNLGALLFNNSKVLATKPTRLPNFNTSFNNVGGHGH